MKDDMDSRAFRIEKEKKHNGKKGRWNDCKALQRKDEGGIYGFNTNYQRNEACIQY